MPRFVAKVYSDYQLPHDTVLSTPETARAYSGERVVSPEYSVPHDAFRFTQSDAALDRRDDAGGGAVSRARSSVEPRVPDGAGRYGHGVHMQRSDAQDYAGRRRAGGNGGGGGGRFGMRPMEPMPVPSQLLMYRHMQEEHARQKAAERAAAVLAGGRGGGEAAEAVRHYAPDDNPNALYAQPSKVKRQSGGGGAAEPGRMVTVEAVIEDREPADGHRPRSRAKDDVDGRHPGNVYTVLTPSGTHPERYTPRVVHTPAVHTPGGNTPNGTHPSATHPDRFTLRAVHPPSGTHSERYTPRAVHTPSGTHPERTPPKR